MEIPLSSLTALLQLLVAQMAFAVCSLQPDFSQGKILADEALWGVLGLLAPRDSPDMIQSILDKHPGLLERHRDDRTEIKQRDGRQGQKVCGNQALGNQKVQITRCFFSLSLH